MIQLLLMPNGRVILAPKDGPFTSEGMERIGEELHRAALGELIVLGDQVEVIDLRERRDVQ